MRAITVSTAVYAAIWANRQSGEENEDQILARLLKVDSSQTEIPSASGSRDFAVVVGFSDPRFGFEVPNGFSIFRTFKGKKFGAQAIQGFWVSSADNKGYPSLNELSRSIGAGTENAWKAWFYIDEKGAPRPVSDMRNESTITKRTSGVVTLNDLGL